MPVLVERRQNRCNQSYYALLFIYMTSYAPNATTDNHGGRVMLTENRSGNFEQYTYVSLTMRSVWVCS